MFLIDKPVRNVHLKSKGSGVLWYLTCFQAVMIEVRAAAVIGFTQIVTSTSWRIGHLQLEAPPLTGARCADPV